MFLNNYNKWKQVHIPKKCTFELDNISQLFGKRYYVALSHLEYFDNIGYLLLHTHLSHYIDLIKELKECLQSFQENLQSQNYNDKCYPFKSKLMYILNSFDMFAFTNPTWDIITREWFHRMFNLNNEWKWIIDEKYAKKQNWYSCLPYALRKSNVYIPNSSAFNLVLYYYHCIPVIRLSLSGILFFYRYWLSFLNHLQCIILNSTFRYASKLPTWIQYVIGVQKLFYECLQNVTTNYIHLKLNN
jgi:hypothetical protein